MKYWNQQQIFSALQCEPFFKYLDHTMQQRLCEEARLFRYLPEQHIQVQHQDIYFLLQGVLHVGWLQLDGEFRSYSYLAAPCLFNLVSGLQQKLLNMDYISITPSVLIQFPSAMILQAVQQKPEMQWQLLNLLSERMFVLLEQQRYVVSTNLNQKIAYKLLQLLECQQCDLLRISQQEFADLLHISRQTLHKYLRDFLDLNILTWHYNRLHILDVEQLKKCVIDGNIGI